MNSVERREKLLQILAMRGRTTIKDLAQALEVSPRTVMRDVDALSLSKPITVVSGRYGGVCISDYSTYYRLYMKDYEISLLKKIIDDHEAHSYCALTSTELQMLKEIVACYSTPMRKKRDC